MKNVIYVFLMVLVFVSCKKDQSVSKEDEKEPIVETSGLKSLTVKEIDYETAQVWWDRSEDGNVLLTIAEDDAFANIISGYNSLKVNSPAEFYKVTGLKAATKYYIKANIEGKTKFETSSFTTKSEITSTISISDITYKSFKANVSETSSLYLQMSENVDFTGDKSSSNALTVLTEYMYSYIIPNKTYYLRLAQKNDLVNPGIVSSVSEVKTLNVPSPEITAVMDAENNMRVNVESTIKQEFEEVVQYSFEESFTDKIDAQNDFENRYFIPLVNKVYIRMINRYKYNNNSYDSDPSNVVAIDKVADFIGKIEYGSDQNRALNISNSSVDFTSTPSNLSVVNSGNNVTISMVIDNFDYYNKKDYIIKTGLDAVIPANTYVLIESPDFPSAKSSDAGAGTLAFKEIAVNSNFIVGILEHAKTPYYQGNLKDSNSETMKIHAYIIIRKK